MVTEIKIYKTICPHCELVQNVNGQKVKHDATELLCLCVRCGNFYAVDLDDYNLCYECGTWNIDWDYIGDRCTCFSCQKKMGIVLIGEN